MELNHGSNWTAQLAVSGQERNSHPKKGAAEGGRPHVPRVMVARLLNRGTVARIILAIESYYPDCVKVSSRTNL
mgnify:CR=1 FL=1